jgi:uncharacterized protein involved in exopolysaccharide biosynthesis
MSTTQEATLPVAGQEDDTEISLLDLLAVIGEEKRLIAMVVAVAVAAGLAIALRC